MTDEQLVALFFARDEQAIVETKDNYGKKLQRIALRIVQNHEDAEECENDTYLSAWESIPPHNPKTYLFSYLAKITRNHSINLYNKQHTQKRYANIVVLTEEMEECIPNPTEEAVDSKLGLSEVLNKFLWKLPETQRNIFILRYWYGKSMEELAKDFGFSQSKVKSMLFRTRNKLKSHFESEGYFL
ncbi:MAG: RNA polymerase sigma factor [Eubacteriales bacterium]